MVKGKLKIGEQLPEPPLNVPLQVVKAEQIKTAQRGYDGIRTELRDRGNNVYATMLWLQDVTSTGSKIGSFCYAFHGKQFVENGEYDTDLWIGKWIKMLRRERGNNLVEVITPPSGETELVSNSGGLK